MKFFEKKSGFFPAGWPPVPPHPLIVRFEFARSGAQRNRPYDLFSQLGLPVTRHAPYIATGRMILFFRSGGKRKPCPAYGAGMGSKQVFEYFKHEVFLLFLRMTVLAILPVIGIAFMLPVIIPVAENVVGIVIAVSFGMPFEIFLVFLHALDNLFQFPAVEPNPFAIRANIDQNMIFLDLLHADIVANRTKHSQSPFLLRKDLRRSGKTGAVSFHFNMPGERRKPFLLFRDENFRPLMMDIFPVMMDIFSGMMVIFSSMLDKFFSMLNKKLKLMDKKL
jgi:hypothetical protein